jgi:hypothetical protein
MVVTKGTVLFLGILAMTCQSTPALDIVGADALLLAKEGEESFLCRTDVVIRGGIVANHATDIRDCLERLEQLGKIETHCQPSGIGGHCGGIVVEPRAGQALLHDSKLLVACGTVIVRASKVESLGTVARVSVDTVLRVSEEFLVGVESCKMVSDVLPRSGRRIARWEQDEWHLD